MTGVRAVGRLRWAAIGAGLVLAGCGTATAPTAQLSHAASRRDPASRSAPNLHPAAQRRAALHQGLLRTTDCPSAGPAQRHGAERHSRSPTACSAAPRSTACRRLSRRRPRPAARRRTPLAQPNDVQRCTEVYCVIQAVPRGPANRSAPKPPAVEPNDAQRCTEVYCVTQAVPAHPATFSTTG